MVGRIDFLPEDALYNLERRVQRKNRKSGFLDGRKLFEHTLSKRLHADEEDEEQETDAGEYR